MITKINSPFFSITCGLRKYFNWDILKPLHGCDFLVAVDIPIFVTY